MKHRGDRYNNRAFKGAYGKGWAAGYANESKDGQPYNRKAKTSKGGVTFGRGLARAWLAGWGDGQASYQEMLASSAAQLVTETEAVAA